MMKINKKGFTTIELLVCFVIVSAISISMFGIVMNYKERQQVESIRNDVLAYKYSMTKMIQDDIIKHKIIRVYKGEDSNSARLYIIFEDENNPGAEGDWSVIEAYKTKPLIKYSFKKPGISHIGYPLPDIADLKIEQGTYFTIDTVGDKTFVTIDIPFSHPDLTDKDYGIHIVFPY